MLTQCGGVRSGNGVVKVGRLPVGYEAMGTFHNLPVRGKDLGARGYSQAAVSRNRFHHGTFAPSLPESAATQIDAARRVQRHISVSQQHTTEPSDC